MVRLLDKNDLKNYYDLRLEMLKLVPTAFGMSYEEEKEKGSTFMESILTSTSNKNVIYGAFTENKLVGSIGIFAEPRLKSKHKAMIWGMYVKDSERGKGLGKQLVNAALDHAKKYLNVKSVYLSVEASNRPAKSLYLSCGFKEWGLEPRAICVDETFYDECHMYLHL